MEILITIGIIIFIIIVIYLVFKMVGSTLKGGIEVEKNKKKEQIEHSDRNKTLPIDESNESQLLGAAMAETCLTDLLANGEYIQMSKIKSRIKEINGHNPDLVENGFLRAMHNYMSNGKVIVINGENEETFFIHSDFKAKYLAAET